MKQNRRAFIGTAGSLTAAGLLWGVEGMKGNAFTPPSGKMHISCNQYAWVTFYKRQGSNWTGNMAKSIEVFAKSGIPGYEPSARSPRDLTDLAPLLKKHKIEMRSVYVGGILHKEPEGAATIENILAIARAARDSMGTAIIVHNPSPVNWKKNEVKTDEALQLQARNLDKVGAELRKMGMKLAYHNHDKELLHGAREFHHMMLGTDPEYVSLCLEPHWLYRGSGNSQLALFDIIQLYGERIVELHLRQSRHGVWTEVFGEGDIDYQKVADELLRLKLQPHLVLEQCIESETPHTMNALAAHRKDLEYASRLFSNVY